MSEETKLKKHLSSKVKWPSSWIGSKPFPCSNCCPNSSKPWKNRLGVSAAAPVAAAAAPAAGGEAAAAEEQTEFDVVLNSPGGQKIAVIKELRTITGAGLKEAKEMAETADVVVKAGASKEEAEGIKTKLEAAGAAVTVK